jgi:hypothetical protein
MKQDRENIDNQPLAESESCCSRSSCCDRQSPVVHTAPKVGRKDPCPCASGRKFKKCCG